MPRLARAGRRIRKPIWPGRGRSGVNGLGTGEGVFDDRVIEID
jgi:hypothetical protein